MTLNPYPWSPRDPRATPVVIPLLNRRRELRPPWFRGRALGRCNVGLKLHGINTRIRNHVDVGMSSTKTAIVGLPHFRNHHTRAVHHNCHPLSKALGPYHDRRVRAWWRVRQSARSMLQAVPPTPIAML